MPIDNELTEDQYDIYGRGYAAGLKQGADLAYEQCADEIADLKADHADEIMDLRKKLDAAYAEDKPTQPTREQLDAQFDAGVIRGDAGGYKRGLLVGAARERGTQPHTWSETYAETLPRHGEDEAGS